MSQPHSVPQAHHTARLRRAGPIGTVAVAQAARCRVQFVGRVPNLKGAPFRGQAGDLAHVRVCDVPSQLAMAGIVDRHRQLWVIRQPAGHHWSSAMYRSVRSCQLEKRDCARTLLDPGAR